MIRNRKRRGPASKHVHPSEFASEAEYQEARKRTNNRLNYANNRKARIVDTVLWGKRNPEKRRKNLQNTRRRRRDEVVNKLGGKCKKCGFKDVRALQVDHIKQAKEPRGHWMRHGEGLHRALLSGRKSWREVQLLCANCNWIKRYENNECPGSK